MEQAASLEHGPSRILYLAPFPPRLDATHGGARVMAQVICAIAKHHCVAVMYLRAHDEPDIDPEVRARCDRVWEIARPEHGRGGVRHWIHRMRVLGGLVRGRPEWVMNWRVPACHRQLKFAVQTWAPDIIQVEYAVMGQYLEGLRNFRVPSILTIHEPASNAAGERDLRPRRRSIQLLLNRCAWKRYERSAMELASAVVVFTERDRMVISKLSPEARIMSIPLGADITTPALDPLGSTPPSIVFIGNFIHPPNVDAAQRLTTSIFPEVQAKVPDVTLLIVGDRAPDHIRLLASESIIVTGWVPSVVPFLNRAALVVAPIRLGGGMRVKILEALVAGKAIVVSPRAVEGIGVQSGVHVVVADSDQEFADSIVSLLRHEDRRLELARSARAWALANLDWGDAMTLYDGLYVSLKHEIAADGAVTVGRSSSESGARK